MARRLIVNSLYAIFWVAIGVISVNFKHDVQKLPLAFPYRSHCGLSRQRFIMILARIDGCEIVILLGRLKPCISVKLR